MWTLPNYAQGCGIALVDGVDLELTTFLSRHDGGELYVLVGSRKVIGNCMGLNEWAERRNMKAQPTWQLDGAELEAEETETSALYSLGLQAYA